MPNFASNPLKDIVAKAPLFDPLCTDLHVFHPAIGQALASGSFRKVRKLADATQGKVYLYALQDEPVMVKTLENRKVDLTRTLEANDRSAFNAGSGVCVEDALNEIGVLQYLSSQPDLSLHLLRLKDVFRDATHTMIVTEHCDQGELFGVLQMREYGECEVKKFMRQLFQAVSYLHNHNIAHRNISLENILVKGGDLKLMDFGQAVQIHQPQDQAKRFRYFRLCGKHYYRAPECYVPHGIQTWHSHCPPDYTCGKAVMVQHAHFLTEVVFHPGFVPSAPSSCEPCGFEAPPVDLFACGVILFILHGRMPPWRMALLSDSCFASAYQDGIASLFREKNIRPLSAGGMELLAVLTSHCPPLRLSAPQCLEHPWFGQ